VAGRRAAVRAAGAVALAVVRHPSLWRVGVRQWRRTVAPGWWRQAPFLPVPPAEYLQFRVVTQNGRGGAAVQPADVINYLAWCKRHR
jgi:hypothetical protein